MNRARFVVILISAVLCLGLAGGYFIHIRGERQLGDGWGA